MSKHFQCLSPNGGKGKEKFPEDEILSWRSLTPTPCLHPLAQFSTLTYHRPVLELGKRPSLGTRIALCINPTDHFPVLPPTSCLVMLPWKNGLRERSMRNKPRIYTPKFSEDSSVQFSSVTQSCLTLWDPMNCSFPGLPVHHQLLEFTQMYVNSKASWWKWKWRVKKLA